jgi:transposase InsO family protein
MALKAVSMAELRLEVLLAAERNGESVSEVCRRYGISRQTYYRYRRRFLGGEGLGDRSRRPQRSPGQIDAELEEMICRMRRAHPRWGARRIRAELGRVGVAAPAISTIHQVLRRNHLVADQPPRKPKALRRFERDISNDLWQIDATEVVLVDQTKSYVFDLLDDHSRYLLAAIAAQGPTGEAAWDCFEDAASRYGLPAQLLSDNGLCFTGRLHGMQVDFERSLTELGVQLINARPYHPQTVGKLERFHRTLKEWLTDEGPACDLAHLQELLDGFRFHYNRERPHQGIDDQTPAERYEPARTPSALVAISVGYDINGEPIYPPESIVRAVSSHGKLTFANKQIQVGREFNGARVRVIRDSDDDQLVHLYYGNELLRAVTIDPTRRYQGRQPPTTGATVT